MEMHTSRSLYEVHGISVAPAVPRRHPDSRYGLTRILAFLKAAATAIKTELAIRRSIDELSEMNDHMLRDIGINRCEIESAVRGLRAHVETTGASTPWRARHGMAEVDLLMWNRGLN